MTFGPEHTAFNLSFRYKIKKELFVAAEGMYTGQFVYCGRKVNLLDS
jgi:large subunit ribosomal protein L8e